MFEEIEDPVGRMRALWDTLDREELPAVARLGNARQILAILTGLPPVPEAEALVAAHRRRISEAIAALSAEAEREEALRAAARELFEAMGAVVRDLEKLPPE
ncbi:MAG: hypothetical protein ACP5VN_09175 [Acidobacteriota bacterium]